MLSFRNLLSSLSNQLSASRARRGTTRPKPRWCRPSVEPLEDRCVPANVVFTAAYGAPQTSKGGDVLTGDVPVYLIFTGGPNALYGYNYSVKQDDLVNAVKNIFNSPYLSGLAEYGAATRAHLAGTYDYNFGLGDQNGVFTVDGNNSDINNIVSYSINDNAGTLPEPDDTDPNGIYIVFTPLGYTIAPPAGSPAPIGEHSKGDTGGFLDGDNAYDAAITSSPVWVPSPIPTANQPANQVTRIELSPLDSMTSIFSHELVETITDPDKHGVSVTATNSYVQNWGGANEPVGEICDYEGQFYGAHENGTAVQSYWSLQGGAYIVPGGTNRYALSSGVGSASLAAFEGTLVSYQYTSDHAGVYALDNHATLWKNFGYEWQQVAKNVRSFTLFWDTPIITYINTPPHPQSPYVDQAVTTTTPTFTWDAVSGATSYSVSVTDAQTHTVVASASGLTGTSWTPSTPLVDGRGYQWQVQSYTPLNGSLLASDPSSPIYFFVNVSGTLSLISPALGSTVTTGTPTLQWAAVPGASGYALSLYDVTTGTTVINGWSISTSSFSLTVPLPSGHKFQWTVTGNDSGHSSATGVFTVSVPGATGSLAAPVLSGPSGLLTTGTPTFRWSAVPGATGYGLYIVRANSTMSTWANPIRVSGTSYTPTSSLNDGFYPGFLWWVTAFDAAGNVSPVSQSLDFGMAVPNQWVDTATASAPSGTVNTLNPTFQWSAVSGASGNGYGYYLSVVDETAHAVAFDKYVATGNSYTIGAQGGTSLINGHTYRWYVAALTFLGLGPAGMQTFTTAFPSTPTPLSAGGLQATATPTLQWSASTGATGYYLTVTDLTTGRAVVDALSLAATSYTLPSPLSTADAYRWQVIAYDGAGNVSSPSAPVAFTVTTDLAAPALIPLESPVAALTPMLQWGAVANAAGYNVHLVDTTTSAETVVPLAAPATVFTAAPLTDGHSYQWWVVALDSAGNLGPVSAALTFTVQLPPAPTSLAPSGVTSATPTLQWSAPIGYVSYVLRILDVTAAQPEYVTVATPVTGTSFTLSTPLVDGHLYLWRVRGVDGAGNTSDWSTSQFIAGADASLSTLATGTTTLSVGDSTTITLTARDANGNQETSGGLAIGFGLGGGSGQGKFGPVQDNGDGTYSAVFTATAFGGNTITATINGRAVVGSVTIKPGPPKSHVNALPPKENDSFTLKWTANDGLGGASIATWDVFVSQDGGPFTAWQTGLTASSALYSGAVAGHTYAFYVVAHDYLGQVESKIPTAETQTTISDKAWQNAENNLDIDHDGMVTPSDAVDVISDLNSLGPNKLPSTRPSTAFFLDTDGDYQVTPSDADAVISHLSSFGAGEGESGIVSDQASLRLPPPPPEASEARLSPEAVLGLLAADLASQPKRRP